MTPVAESLMLALQPAQERTLRGQSVQLDRPDANTLILREVPVDVRRFNKPRTNVLIKRPSSGMPFLTGVDEDLEYTGSDPALVRAFTTAPKRDGWRIVALPHLDRDLSQAVDRALVMLGNPAGQTSPRPVPGLLDTFGVDLSAALDQGGGELTCGREEELETVLSTLISQGQVRLPLVTGKSGVGKTNLLWAVARRMQALRPGTRLVAVDLPTVWAGTMFEAERERLFATILDEARLSPEVLLAVEMLGLAAFGQCGLLLTRALDQGLRLIGTTLLESTSRFKIAPLARRVVTIPLSELSQTETLAALEAAAGPLSESHGVQVTPDLLSACVRLSRSVSGCFPAKSLAVLDAGLARARLSGNDALSLDDLSTAARQLTRVKRT